VPPRGGVAGGGRSVVVADGTVGRCPAGACALRLDDVFRVESSPEGTERSLFRGIIGEAQFLTISGCLVDDMEVRMTLCAARLSTRQRN
jgi:hypothetical protein